MFMELMMMFGLIASPAGANEAARVPDNYDGDSSAALEMVRTAPLILIQNRLFTLARVDGEKERLFLIDNGCDYTMVDPMLAPILLSVAMQLLAYHAARMKGCAIDKPRNLAKSVTVE